MEPKLPAPNLGPETPAVNYGQNIERAPLPPMPEVGIEQKAEQFEQRREATPATTEASVPVLPPPIVVPEPTTPSGSDSTATTNVSDAPLVANDDDLIEKEWVDKAKKIIVETKDDPYKREQEVGKLQVDYLRKRYGKELGVSQ